MEFINQLLESTEINGQTATLRLLLSFFVGMLVGLERETHNQPAGLRTHILISIGATIVMLISIFIPQTFANFQNGDPGRIAAQVVSGIGFLGGGAILKFGANVKGLTTAASIWAMAAIGLAVGAGMYSISLIGVLVVLFALTIMNFFEKRFFKERTLRKVEVTIKKKHTNLKALKDIFKTFDVKINSTGFDRNVHEATDKITFLVGVTPFLNVQQLADELEKEPGIVTVLVEIIQ
ncbi:putative Mg2+ transporter-C (MgtC) family protein [Tangfeifania diversioriginum]|uniref:Putative Mg2+ transporter-C (MgtC) family protein n=1 Tax=Tangfeifania diversioriginum TaxID=1168035 RepID=A0A1M6G6Z3_9BACT|nr:MgtC/SapB family protein [Tangfeifania diversioriginum]SHJ05694.1 putative Mg2+ transporter-C (MgtC) family protein [Tangfeifania diversioriginum]